MYSLDITRCKEEEIGNRVQNFGSVEPLDCSGHMHGTILRLKLLLKFLSRDGNGGDMGTWGLGGT